MAAARYFLEHFYHGQLVVDGKPDPERVLIGASSGLNPELVQAALDIAQLPPILVGDSASWALVRGSKRIPFLLVQSQIGTLGQHIAHYVIIPSEVLRAVAGNIIALSRLIEREMPLFTQTGYRPKPLAIEQPDPETSEQQVEAILDLMTALQNKLDSMERLLAALVQGKQIIIQGAPPRIDERVRFLQGLLALLPMSVRFAVTFSTYSTPTANLDVQVCFFNDETPPAESLVFLWQSARLVGVEVSDEYSRFVMSQLRLDPHLVIERTRSLTPPTGWRMRQGDKLAEALAYGSYRLKVDHALLNNLAVNKDDVARILTSDPTLTESLQRLYALHLLKFSLVMDSLGQADPVVSVFNEYPDIEKAAIEEIRNAPTSTALKLVIHWLNHGYALNRRADWIDFASQSALAQTRELLKSKDSARLVTLINQLNDAGDAVSDSALNIAEAVLPVAYRDAAVAEALLVFGAVHLDKAAFQRMLNNPQFIKPLRPVLRQALSALSGESSKGGALIIAAQAVGGSHELALLTRFAEVARYADRTDLLDAEVLAAVARLAARDDGARYAENIRIVCTRPTNEQLTMMGHAAAYQLLRAKLALGDYADLAGLMIQQSSVLYPGEKQLEYIQMVERLFAETPVPADRLQRALTEINVNGIKSAPLVMASLGALTSRAVSPELDRVAVRVEDMLSNDALLLGVVPIDSILKLLEYYARGGAINDAVRVADLIPIAAEHQQVNNLEVSSKMYRVMDNDETTRTAGLDILRVYVRNAEDSAARQAVIYYGRELGPQVRSALQATYYVTRLTEGDLVEFAYTLRIAALLLHDITASYMRGAPELIELNAGMQRISGSYSLDERRLISRGVLDMGREIAQLFQLHQPLRVRDSAALFNAKADPNTALDLLRVVVGHFSEGQPIALRFNQMGGFPLRERTRKVLFNEVQATRKLLKWLLEVLPTGKSVNISATHVRLEVESLLSLLDAPTRSTVSRILSTDLPRLIELIELIATSGDARVLESDNATAQRIDKGRHKPRSVLEFLRYLSVYIQTHG